jgi:regulator of protease activity HflC (stomatin/prohibitin superfamily)
VRDVAVATGVRRRRLDDGTLAPRAWGRLGATFGGLLLLLVVWTSVHVVPAGSVAGPVTLGRAGSPIGPGVHITLPFTQARTMSVRTQQYTMSAIPGEGSKNVDDSVQVLGSDGAGAGVDATVLYRLDKGQARDVFEDVGTDYVVKIIRPSARNCIRSEFTDYAIVDAATTSWHKLEDDVAECMAGKMEPRGLVLDDFQLREVHLGDDVQSAIDAKVAAQQDSERQRFELTKAQQAADITRVDAIATADAQQILACGGETITVERDGKQVQVIAPKPIERCSQAQLTPAYLQFTYIQALKQLVNSPNNSTIILPFDQNLTPLIDVSGGQPTLTPSSVSTPGAGSSSAASGTAPGH